MQIKKNQTLLMVGDSITDSDRTYPLGEGIGLGNGYVSVVDALLRTCHPEIPVRILNTGISGNRVVDLEKRWETDVLSYKPDWVSIMIGVNDVWRQFDSPLVPEQVDIVTYEKKLEGLIEKTLAAVEGLVLMTPFFLEKNRSDEMRSKVDEYAMVVKKLAEKHSTVFVDVQAAFDECMEHMPFQILSMDRVHPNLTGHLIIAKAFTDAIGLVWNRRN